MPKIYTVQGTVALVAATALNIAHWPTTAVTRARLVRAHVSDRLAGATDPAIVMDIRLGKAGSPAGTATTPSPLNGAPPAIANSAVTTAGGTILTSLTTSPTGMVQGPILNIPVGGIYDVESSDATAIVAPISSAINVFLTSANLRANVDFTLWFSEE